MKEKFLPHFQFINQFTKETLACIHAEIKTNKVSEFIYGLLDRLNKASFFQMMYFENIDSYIFLEFSRGITVRAIMMDMLITIKAISLVLKYYSDFTTKSAEEIINYIDSVFGDGIDLTKGYFNDLYKQGKIDGTEYKNLLLSVENLISDLNSKNKKINIKHLHQDNEKSGMNSLIIYDRYLYYSKLDHYSRTYQFMVNKTQPQMEKEWFLDVENMLVQNFHLHYFLVNYFPDINFLKTQFERSEKYIDDFKASKKDH